MSGQRVLRSSKFKKAEEAIKSPQIGELNKNYIKRPPSEPQLSESGSAEIDIQEEFSIEKQSKQQKKKDQPSKNKIKSKRTTSSNSNVRKSRSKSQLKKNNIKQNQNQNIQSSQDIMQSRHSIKAQKKKPQKKKIKEKQENQGVKIIEERKIKYLFRNICDPDGFITLQSLGKSLLKHKIQFKLKDLKEMLKIVNPQQEFKNDEISDNSLSQNENVNEGQIEQWMKDMKIPIEEFNQFYDKFIKK